MTVKNSVKDLGTFRNCGTICLEKLAMFQASFDSVVVSDEMTAVIR